MAAAAAPMAAGGVAARAETTRQAAAPPPPDEEGTYGPVESVAGSAMGSARAHTTPIAGWGLRGRGQRRRPCSRLYQRCRRRA